MENNSNTTEGAKKPNLNSSKLKKIIRVKKPEAAKNGSNDKENAKGFMNALNGGDSSGSGGGGGGGSFAQNGLKAHNMFRKIHNAPAMTLDDKMSKEAEEYAKKLASMGTLQHAQTDYGENLAMKCSSRKEDKMTAEEATRNW